jgi:hypothetical protein
MPNTSLPLSSNRRNGDNGATHHPAPNSRRAFLRSAPARIGVLEDGIEVHALRFDAIATRLSEEGRRTLAIETRLNNLSEIVQRLTGRLDRVDARSARACRRIAVLSDQAESNDLS